MKSCPLGVVEGFYGEPWSWEAREASLPFLAAEGYSQYYYAPKGDAWLRKRWREPLPLAHRERLARLSAQCFSLGIDFGVGLTPVGLTEDGWNDVARAALGRRLAELAEMQIDRLALLFDDMSGSPDLARRQIEIAHWVQERSGAQGLALCPTYYSDDPVLDRLFGPRPTGYLEELGRDLDPSFEIFWTGEQICSKSYSEPHLQRVAEQLRRKPLLWDNYPVNDTPKLCLKLNLRPFSGRPPVAREWLTGHLVNPMNQPLLSRVPLATLRDDDSASDRDRFLRAAARVTGPALAERLWQDLELLADRGLDDLSNLERETLIHDYQRLAPEAPAAREVIEFLTGHSRISAEQVRAQQ